MTTIIPYSQSPSIEARLAKIESKVKKAQANAQDQKTEFLNHLHARDEIQTQVAALENVGNFVDDFNFGKTTKTRTNLKDSIDSDLASLGKNHRDLFAAMNAIQQLARKPKSLVSQSLAGITQQTSDLNDNLGLRQNGMKQAVKTGLEPLLRSKQSLVIQKAKQDIAQSEEYQRYQELDQELRALTSGESTLAQDLAQINIDIANQQTQITRMAQILSDGSLDGDDKQEARERIQGLRLALTEIVRKNQAKALQLQKQIELKRRGLSAARQELASSIETQIEALSESGPLTNLINEQLRDITDEAGFQAILNA